MSSTGIGAETGCARPLTAGASIERAALSRRMDAIVIMVLWRRPRRTLNCWWRSPKRLVGRPKLAASGGQTNRPNRLLRGNVSAYSHRKLKAGRRTVATGLPHRDPLGCWLSRRDACRSAGWRTARRDQAERYGCCPSDAVRLCCAPLKSARAPTARRARIDSPQAMFSIAGRCPIGAS